VAPAGTELLDRGGVLFWPHPTMAADNIKLAMILFMNSGLLIKANAADLWNDPPQGVSL
jgi:hypothetical protein